MGLPFWGDQLRLSEIRPRHVGQLVAHLTRQEGATGRPLADNTIRNILNPVRACLSTAVEDGLLRTNPAQRVRLSHRPRPEDEDSEQVRPPVHSRAGSRLPGARSSPHRLMLRLLAATGLRISELFALEPLRPRATRSRPWPDLSTEVEARKARCPPRARARRWAT